MSGITTSLNKTINRFVIHPAPANAVSETSINISQNSLLVTVGVGLQTTGMIYLNHVLVRDKFPAGQASQFFLHVLPLSGWIRRNTETLGHIVWYGNLPIGPDYDAQMLINFVNPNSAEIKAEILYAMQRSENP